MTTMGTSRMRSIEQDQTLADARSCARLAAKAIKPSFGERSVVSRKGFYDVQLKADVVAHEVIERFLRQHYPTYSIISEEGSNRKWSGTAPLWAVDPLDGTNNFGYGVAHCAVVLSLLGATGVELAVIHDPIMGREFFGSTATPYQAPPPRSVVMPDATISLVNDYSKAGRQRGERVQKWLGRRCKRVLTLWAPGLDLALVANGNIDGMVCVGADYLDVCAGAYLLEAAGGCFLGMDGKRFTLDRSCATKPVQFVAARDLRVAEQLVKCLRIA